MLRLLRLRLLLRLLRLLVVGGGGWRWWLLTRDHVLAGEAMTDEEILEMIQAADMDKDGMINEEEFWRIMKKGLAC